MYYLLTLCFKPNDCVCSIAKSPLELVRSREKIGICLGPVLSPCPSKGLGNRKIVGRTKNGFAKDEYGV